MAVFRRHQFSAEKGICHMQDNTIAQLPDPSGFTPDPFPDVIRDAARKLIEQAIHAEPAALMAAFSAENLEDGLARLVRHGHLPEREVPTGIGPAPVKVPRVRDRKPGEDKITFMPGILPRCRRKAESVEDLLSWLYLQGVSTGDFTEALEALLGSNAKGLSARTITRLKADWREDCKGWQKRDLGARRFLCIRADGVCFKPRMLTEKQCVLVIIGADEYGHNELLAMTDGFRESTESWREVLLDPKRRGLKQNPKLAIGDGALGFWTALREVFATTRKQRCWVHKTTDVLNAMPKSLQAKAKGHLHDVRQLETRAEAEVAFDFFVKTYGVKWDKAVARLVKDRSALLAFHDFPAEHWKHVRTSNPPCGDCLQPPAGQRIESTFATVLHRTKRTRGCLGRKTGLAMAFKLMMTAQKKWRKLDGQNRLPEIIEGVEFRDGLRHLQTAA